MTTAASGYFAANPPHATGPVHGPRFQAVIYTLDLLLPILGLGQRNAFVANGAGAWVAWTATLAGWILATTIVTAATRSLSRG